MENQWKQYYQKFQNWKQKFGNSSRQRY